MRSWLYVPGNNPKMILNAGIYGADGIILDLEDAVPEAEKDEARILAAEALSHHDFGTPRVGIRINGTATTHWRRDLEILFAAGCRLFRVPKVESAGDAAVVDQLLNRLEAGGGEPARLQLILETPRGIENAAAVAEASSRIDALSFGAEDYCSHLGIRRDGPAYALDYPRSRIACAAALAGVACLDTVWAAYRDMDGLESDAQRARNLGFSGKSVIHPGQIETVNRIFSPTPGEIAWAEGILAKLDGVSDGAAETILNTGAFSVDGEMVDPPVIRRAVRIIDEAKFSHD